jgi:hypothetical protein
VTHYRFVRGLIAILAAVASLPLAFILADSPFGLASALVAPLLAVSLVCTVTADEQHRIWWFAFACSAAVWLLVLSPGLESAVNGIAVGLQRLTQRGTISLSQRVIEPTSLALIVIGPPIGAVFTGVGAGWLAQRIRRSRASEGRWRFSMRELLVATFALCMFLALAFGRLRVDHAKENDGKAAFLSRFENSFGSTHVRLLSPPDITGGHRTLIPESGYMSFMPPGINEYRVTAPILKNNKRRWAVWAYTCNGNHDDMIYQFAYAESDTEDGLPTFTAKAYANASWQMIDGAPK